MKNLKEYAEEMRTMATMLGEAADALDAYNDEQLRSVLRAMGLAVPSTMNIAPPPVEFRWGRRFSGRVRREGARADRCHDSLA